MQHALLGRLELILQTQSNKTLCYKEQNTSFNTICEPASRNNCKYLSNMQMKFANQGQRGVLSCQLPMQELQNPLPLRYAEII